MRSVEVGGGGREEAVGRKEDILYNYVNFDGDIVFVCVCAPVCIGLNKMYFTNIIFL